MKRLKGPDLKMPDVKAPAFLEDIYWDLRDRRLLPLVALVVVAIAAVPFLLGGGSEKAPEGAAPDAGASLSTAADGVDASTLTVVQAEPGLRDYRKRLARRTPSNPFKGPGAATRKGNGAQLPGAGDTSAESAGTGAGSGGGEPSGDEPSASGGAAPESPSSGSPETSPPSGDPDGDGKRVVFFTLAIKVRIVKSGGVNAEPGEKEEPAVKERVLPLTELPGEKAPVVTYMGVSKKGKALLMVSNDVKSVFGEAKCVSGDDVCQLLEAEPGFPVTFVYGAGETHYTINVLKIYPVITGRA